MAAATQAERWLRERGAAHVLYKICSTFDSTDAGNIGSVTEALSAAAGGGLVLVTPAFPETIAAKISWAGDRIAAGPVVIAASASPETVLQLQSQYGREASGHAIETATSIIAAELVARGVRRLVIAGGGTSGAAVDRLAIPAFLIGPEIAPGVPVLRTVGNAQGDMLLALKSGNVGGEDFFTAALAMML